MLITPVLASSDPHQPGNVVLNQFAPNNCIISTYNPQLSMSFTGNAIVAFKTAV